MTAAEGEQEEWRLSPETKGTPPSHESFQRLVPLDLVMVYGEAFGKGREMPKGPQDPLEIGNGKMGHEVSTHRFSSKLNHAGAT